MQVASPQANVIRLSGPQRPRGARAILIGALLAGMVGAASWLLWFGKPDAARVGAEAGVSDGEILVGMSSALDGPSQALGLGMRTGADAWLREVNERGGVHGRRRRLVALDDGYEPDRCLANMRELVETRKVFAILRNVGTPTAHV